MTSFASFASFASTRPIAGGFSRVGCSRLSQNVWRVACVALVLLVSTACTGSPSTPGSDEDDVGAGQPSGDSTALPIWLDVDPAIGLPSSEVDDGVMMIQAFNSPEVEIRGVSVVFGNTTFDQALPIARDVVERFGPEGLRVFGGAASSDALGKETAATRALAEALAVERLTILAVGPVTNVGSLLMLHPELEAQIERIVVVAGRRIGQSFLTGSAETPFRDFNFELDPAAMQVLLDSAVPLVMAPWEVSSHVWIRSTDLDRLAESSAAGAWLSESCRTWLARWQETMGVDGFNPFDTLALGWVTHPELMSSLDVGVWIAEDEDDTAPGSGQAKPYLYVDPDRSDQRQAVYIYLPDPAFNELLVERLAGDAR